MENVRLRHLQLRHLELDNLLHEEMKRPSPDSSTLQKLKKLKLKIKQELMWL